jgi:hypothetical protein
VTEQQVARRAAVSRPDPVLSTAAPRPAPGSQVAHEEHSAPAALQQQAGWLRFPVIEQSKSARPGNVPPRAMAPDRKRKNAAFTEGLP